MSRVTAPAIKFARAMSLNATAAARPMVPEAATSSLMPKYAELLSPRSADDHSRSMLTTHGPRYKLPATRPLMQTFYASASTKAKAAGAGAKHIDSTLMPPMAPPSKSPVADSAPQVPHLNGVHPAAAAAAAATEPAHVPTPERLVVAADPSVVAPATPLASVHAMGPDNGELHFANGKPVERAGEDGSETGMFRDIWNGIVEDVMGTVKAKTH